MDAVKEMLSVGIDARLIIGGCRGEDTLAVLVAKALGLPFRERKTPALPFDRKFPALDFVGVKFN